MRYYLSIEKNIEGFELYKALWNARGIDGVRADSMTEGIERAIGIEKSKMDELYFIDIVADDIDFMLQLPILSAETNAPILIAASAYNEAEHHEALNVGADFYGGYCDTPEQNIHAVTTVISSIVRRARKTKPPSKVIV
jgi:CheY-like chemotaxis protein